MKLALRILGLVAALALPGVALAYGVTGGDTVNVPKGDTRSGTYYAMGSRVTIAGTIDGDLVCAGSNITVTGAVHGDVLCAGQTINISGPVDGSVRVAGQTVTLGGSVGRNVTSASQTLITTDAAKIAGDFGAWTQSASIDGTIAKDVYGAMQSLEINGVVGDTNITTQNIVLGQDAKVNGDLRYTSERQLSPDNARVTGTVRFKQAIHHQQSQQTLLGVLIGRAYWVLAALVVAAAFVAFLPGVLRRVTSRMRETPNASLGWGAISILIMPMLVIVFLVTIIGAPLALLTAAMWGLALVVSPIFAGTALGLWFLKRIDWHKNSLWWAAGFGVFVLTAISAVPVIGTFVAIAAASWSLGGILLTVRSLKA